MKITKLYHRKYFLPFQSDNILSSSENWMFSLFRTRPLLPVLPAKINLKTDYCRLKIQVVKLDFSNLILQNRKNNRFRNKLHFLFSSNLIFAGYTGSKNQLRTRQKIEFVSKWIFFWVRNRKKIEWHSIFQKSSGDRQGDCLFSFILH